ncbi:MAG: hypothetical protein ABEJ99_01375 [Candidatus Nanohaloarchaea archaeon]
MKKLAVFTLLALFIASQAAAVSVGAAPGVKDLGTLNRGQTYEVTFYITTNAKEPFEIDPQYSSPLTSIFQRYGNRAYDFNPDNASQESIKSWVKFRNKGRYVIDPSTVKVIRLANGGMTRAAGKVTFDIRVPNDAEPGYHAGALELHPDFSTGGSGNQVRLIAQPHLLFTFKVPGVAVRDLKVTRVRGLRSGDNSARLLVNVKNTGTVTTQITKSDFKVLSKDGESMAELSPGGAIIKPGEVKRIKMTWTQPDELKAGNYVLRGTSDYMTGKAFVDQPFSITDFIQIKNTGAATNNNTGGGNGGSKSALPTWLVVMVLVLLGVIMYSFDIDPVWIILIVGIAAISVFVLMTDLPIWLIAIALIIGVGMVYWW